MLSLAGLALLGAVATLLAGQRAVSASDERDVQMAQTAAARFVAGLQRSVIALRGASGLVVDGRVSMDQFVAFAAEVVPGSKFNALAYSEIVASADRAAWESSHATTIRDTNGQGDLQPSPVRDRYLAIAYVSPITDQTQNLIGFDIASDKVRADGAQAAAAGEAPVLVGPISLANSAEPGLFAINAVRDRKTTIGFVSSGFQLQPLLDDLRTAGGIDRVGLAIDDKPVVALANADATERFTVGARTFALSIDRAGGPDFLVPLLLGLATMGLLGVTALVRRREVDALAQQRVASLRNVALAGLGEQLAEASDSERVMTVAMRESGRVLGADRVVLARVNASDPTTLLVLAGSGDDALPTATCGIDDPSPLARCVRDGRPVSVLAHHGSAVPPLDPFVSAVCVPLRFGTGYVVGALGFLRRSTVTATRAEQLTTTATTLAELVGRALERAVTNEALHDRTGRLGQLTQALSRASTPDEVERAAAVWLPQIVDAATVVIDHGELPADDGALTFPLTTARTASGPTVRITPRSAQAWSPALEAVSSSVIELVAGAWNRAKQQHDEHLVIQNLQASLLLEPPVVPALDIAVAYEPAESTIGIGGDWHDVVHSDDATHLVIGDVVGHGLAALTVMAELKTVIHHLLATGTPMADVLEHADACVARHHTYATALVVRLDARRNQLSFVNAGHLPPLFRRDGNVTVLTGGHRPLLGVPPSEPVTPAMHSWDLHDAIVLYTDGLIEQRGVDLDESIAALAHKLAKLTGTSEQSVTCLLAEEEARPTATDDDVALIVVRSTPAP